LESVTGKLKLSGLMVGIIFNVLLSIAVMAGSRPLGEFFLRIGWPKVKSLDANYRTGWAVVIGALFAASTIINAAVFYFLMPQRGYIEYLFLSLVIGIVSAVAATTAKRRLLGKKTVKVQLPKESLAAASASKKAVERLRNDRKFIKVAKMEKGKLERLHRKLGVAEAPAPAVATEKEKKAREAQAEEAETWMKAKEAEKAQAEAEVKVREAGKEVKKTGAGRFGRKIKALMGETKKEEAAPYEAEVKKEKAERHAEEKEEERRKEAAREKAIEEAAAKIEVKGEREKTVEERMKRKELKVLEEIAGKAEPAAEEARKWEAEGKETREAGKPAAGEKAVKGKEAAGKPSWEKKAEKKPEGAGGAKGGKPAAKWEEGGKAKVKAGKVTEGKKEGKAEGKKLKEEVKPAKKGRKEALEISWPETAEEGKPEEERLSPLQELLKKKKEQLKTLKKK
jgi:hypothetical protein